VEVSLAKRHPSLISLSQDHHHGLALALRLRQGNKALRTDGWTHDRSEQAKRVQEFYDEDLRRHFKAEEEVVFPEMRKNVSASSSLIESLISQHRQLENLVKRIGRSSGAKLEESLISMGQLLEQHIRSEERELFPLFESSMPVEVAERIGQEVERIHEGAGSSRRRQ
jgi:iron-sulfur cluster repair protein YtfE (RIC family)